MRLDITLATALSLETGLVLSAATVARWDTLIVVAPSLLQRVNMVQTKPEVKLEAKAHGLRLALFLSKKKLEDGTLAARNQLNLPGKGRSVLQSANVAKSTVYQTTCMEGAFRFFLFLSACR
jgi:hypothetical protein